LQRLSDYHVNPLGWSHLDPPECPPKIFTTRKLADNSTRDHGSKSRRWTWRLIIDGHWLPRSHL